MLWTAAAVAVMTLTPLAVAAQAESFEELNLRGALKPGDTIFVGTVDAGDFNQLTRGTFLSFSETTIRLESEGVTIDLSEPIVRRIDRRGDSNFNGILIGLGAGAAVGLTLVASCDGFLCPSGASDAAIFAGIGAALGLCVGYAVDALHVGTTHVYQSPRRSGAESRGLVFSMAPVLGNQRKGVVLALRF